MAQIFAAFPLRNFANSLLFLMDEISPPFEKIDQHSSRHIGPRFNAASDPVSRAHRHIQLLIHGPKVKS
jgi:hypothetical protein